MRTTKEVATRHCKKACSRCLREDFKQRAYGRWDSLLVIAGALIFSFVLGIAAGCWLLALTT